MIVPLNESAEAREIIEEKYQDLARVVWSCEMERISNCENPGTPLILSGRIPHDPSSRILLLDVLLKIADSRPEEILFRRQEAQSWWNQQARKLSESELIKESILET